jgi:hypothetical protein
MQLVPRVLSGVVRAISDCNVPAPDCGNVLRVWLHPATNAAAMQMPGAQGPRLRIVMCFAVLLDLKNAIQRVSRKSQRAIGGPRRNPVLLTHEPRGLADGPNSKCSNFVRSRGRSNGVKGPCTSI